MEPEAQNYDILLKNTEPSKNIKPLKAGISGKSSRLSIKSQEAQSWGFETVEVPDGEIVGMTIDDILAGESDADLFIVKIDIEGAEIDMFAGDTGWVARTPLIVFEDHDWRFCWSGSAHAILSVLTRQKRDYLKNGENTFSFSHDLLLR